MLLEGCLNVPETVLSTHQGVKHRRELLTAIETLHVTVPVIAFYDLRELMSGDELEYLRKYRVGMGHG